MSVNLESARDPKASLASAASMPAPCLPGPAPAELRLKFTAHGDARGSLVALEAGRDVPFAVARVYYLFGTTPGAVRGRHAHKRLRQLCIAVSGSCRLVLDDGRQRRSVLLNRPDEGILVNPGIWEELHDFSPDCVLMVLADAPYEESDYIRDYAEFLASLTP